MKTTKFILSFTALLLVLLTFSNMKAEAQILKDINGKTYRTCTFGIMTWSAENLNVDRFRNGDAIPQVTTDADWEKAGKERKPAWCYYANDTAIGRIYGRLYNFYAITDHRGLAPAGWHIPGNSDFDKLISIHGGREVAGIKIKSRTGWKQQINSTNTSGFTALPAGIRNANGSFSNIKNTTQWWSTSGDIAGGPDKWTIGINSFSVQVGYYKMNTGSGLSVRCIKD